MAANSDDPGSNLSASGAATKSPDIGAESNSLTLLNHIAEFELGFTNTMFTNIPARPPNASPTQGEITPQGELPAAISLHIDVARGKVGARPWQRQYSVRHVTFEVGESMPGPLDVTSVANFGKVCVQSSIFCSSSMGFSGIGKRQAAQ